MSDQRRWRRVERDVTQLRLAIRVRDDLTGDAPVGTQRVTVDGELPDARSAGGAYLAFGPPTDETVTVAVEADEHYRDASRTVDLDGRDPRDPVTIDLVPTTAYDYPAWATLLRGRAVDGAEKPIQGVEVSVASEGRTHETTAAGEFAYYFTDVASRAVRRGGETVFEPGGAEPVVEAEHPDGRTTSQSKTVTASSVTRTTFVFP